MGSSSITTEDTADVGVGGIGGEEADANIARSELGGDVNVGLEQNCFSCERPREFSPAADFGVAKRRAGEEVAIEMSVAGVERDDDMLAMETSLKFVGVGGAGSTMYWVYNGPQRGLC
jgi:hypothetical protein